MRVKVLSFLFLITSLLSTVGCSYNSYYNENIIEVTQSDGFDSTCDSNDSFSKKESDDQDNATFDESFVFFTDPHLFVPDGTGSFNEEWFDENIPILLEAYKKNKASFIMCGGDLLNNGDSKNQAILRLKYFIERFSNSFDDFHIIVGNHDTNYQGDTYTSQGDSSCVISQEELADIISEGKKTYYYFDTPLTRYYCFDSGIDWQDDMDDYRWEQVNWFGTDLLLNTKMRSSLFAHISLTNSNTTITPFLENIGKIVNAYNSKESVIVNDCSYDYSGSSGKICFLMAGHTHTDINIYSLGDVPIIITANYSYPTYDKSPTFDCVGIDYTNGLIKCTRYGEGFDRSFRFY